MMIGHASEPLFSSLERVEKGRAAAAKEYPEYIGHFLLEFLY
jgi:hypothetical protein